ncbi:RsmD family RNA methyltransferase [Bergeyella porcorum]|uniref:THUMP-like domain-containing protein n=1 Tax=Bergeyella porcorum TaxID=1735111 RepID=UPI0035EA6D76
MAIDELLSPEIQKFIFENQAVNIQDLLLKKSPFPEVSMQDIVQQIKGLQVAQRKFPFLLQDGIVFPPQLNLEQASSEKTAHYKSNVLKGKKLIDLTCGFGIDAYYLSKNFEEVTLVEQNAELLDIVAHNWNILNKKATFINQKLEDFLNENQSRFDVLYLDPARRDQHQNKVFLLEELSPNLLEIQNQLLEISEEIVIKLSPLIDLKYLIAVLHRIAKIEIIAVKNDVKEVLVFIQSKKETEKILCRCVNLETEEPPFEFYFGEEESETIYSEPEEYLYIPNNAVLKSGAFNEISRKFRLKKLHPNTHLYTSDVELTNFPGRQLMVEIIEPKFLKKGERYNIISKNHPLKPEEIKKKYKLKDGGDQYLVFTQTKKGKITLKSK